MLTETSSRHGRLLIASVTFCAIIIIAAAAGYYLRQRANVEAAAQHELAAIAEIKANQLVNWRHERLGDGRVLQSSANMRIARRVLAGVVQSADRTDLLDTLQKFEQEFLYTGAALVDRNGQIRLERNVTPSDPLRIAELGRAASEAPDVSLQDLYWDAKLARPLMALSIPIQHAGAFILTIDPERFLYPFMRSWPVPTRTGETILARMDGKKLTYLSDFRHNPRIALHLSRSISRAHVQQIESSSRLIFKHKDAYGVSILGSAISVPHSPWILIAKLDTSEVDAPVRRLGWEMALVIALIAIANSAGVGFIWRDQQIRIYRQREAWLRQMADETPAFLWVISADHAGMFINKPLAEFVGGSQNQDLGDTWKSYVHPEDEERVAKNYYGSVAAGVPFVDEHRLRRSDGEYRWFIARGLPRFSQTGQLLRYSGSLFDITERKTAEQRARESAELLEAQNRVLELIAKNTPLEETLDALLRAVEQLSPGILGSILLLDADGLHLHHGVAPSLPETFRTALDGVGIGVAPFRRDPVLVPDIAGDPLWKDYREIALENGLAACWSTPIFAETEHGERPLLGLFALYLRSPLAPAQDGALPFPTPRHRELVEMVTSIAAIAISKAREAEALKISEERFRLATIGGKLGIWDWQMDRDRLIWTGELRALFGWPEDGRDLTSKTVLDVIYPEDRDRVESALRQAIESDTDFAAEYRVLVSDGVVRWFASNGHAQYGGPRGMASRMLGVTRDITSRKLAELQLRAANLSLAQQLEERARTEKEIKALTARLINAQEDERTRLARDLHDDVGQQIAALSLAVSNLRRGIPSEFTDTRTQSERIREKLVHLADSTRRLSHELHPAVLQHCGLELALRGLCSEFRAPAGIKVNFRSDGSFDTLPPAVALCAFRVAQEALQNVAKHARTDEANVALQRSEQTMTLTVSDHGIGMDLNMLRGGLGLTSIQERARLLNGTVEIQSHPNSGAILILTLPI